MTRDEAQSREARDRWNFCEVVSIDNQAENQP
jgi:hypothetical protein